MNAPHAPGSRKRLTRGARHAFAGSRLFDRIGRAVCEAECLPRKELYESWEVARRVRRRFRGGRVVDLACGHGLLASLMLVLDDSSPFALAVDRRVPPCAEPVRSALEDAFPRLAGRVRIETQHLDEVPLYAGDVIVCAHGCGALTDLVLARAVAARARVAVLPCCQSHGKLDTGGLAGWLDPSLAIDVTRASRLREAGYLVHTQTIPETITPKNRLLFGWPAPSSAAGEDLSEPGHAGDLHA